MAGWPARPNRTAFGGTYVDSRPVRDKTKEVSAKIGNLSFWQIAGMGVTAPLAWAIVNSSGNVVAHAEAWNPNGDQQAPVFTSTGTGTGELEYASTYNDEEGNPIPTDLQGAVCTLQEAATGIPYSTAFIKAGSSNIIEVETGGSNAGAKDPQDLAFLVVIF